MNRQQIRAIMALGEEGIINAFKELSRNTDNLSADLYAERAKCVHLQEQLKSVTAHANLYGQLAASAVASGQIEIRLDENLPPSSGMVIQIDAYIKRVEELKQYQREAVEMAFILGDLRRTIDHIDLLALHSPRKSLKKKLAKYRSKLRTLQFKLQRRIKDMNVESASMKRVMQFADLRRKAIKEVGNDNGASLIAVVKDTSVDFKREAEAEWARLQNDIHAGMQAKEWTKRLHEYGKMFYYDHNHNSYNERRNWEQAARACVDYLHNKKSFPDDLDREILKYLGKRDSDYGRLGDEMRKCFHRREHRLKKMGKGFEENLF